MSYRQWLKMENNRKINAAIKYYQQTSIPRAAQDLRLHRFRRPVRFALQDWCRKIWRQPPNCDRWANIKSNIEKACEKSCRRLMSSMWNGTSANVVLSICVFFSVDVCMYVRMSACLSDDNFRKPWHRKFIFAYPVYILAIQVKFVYEGHRIKV